MKRRTNLEKDPWGIKEHMGGSVTSSPRSKATRSSYAQSEYQIIAAFIKNNLKLFLRLISTDIHNKEVSLSATEFNTLRILFKIQGSDGQPINTTGKHLSSFAPFYQSQASASGPGNSTSIKVHMNEINDWINMLIQPVESIDS